MNKERSYYQTQFDALLSQDISSYEELVQWIADCDALDSELGLQYAWAYIHQTTNTADEEAKKVYWDFIQHIYPEWIKISDIIGRKLIACPFVSQLPPEYANYIRSVRHGIELFREENIPLMSQEKDIESKFWELMGALTITYNGEELTMKQAEQYLKSSDREVRKTVWELMESRRKQDADTLDDVMSQLIVIRTQIAQNCGFINYTDYKFSFRYDYTREQLNQFHEAIRIVMTPIVQTFFEDRKRILWVDILKPYDFDAPLFGDVNSELFSTTDEMIDKLCLLLDDMDPALEQYIRHLREINNLDLDTRKNKWPWWYCYPLAGSPDAFVFMNAMRDAYGWFTRAHEAGHAIHHNLTRHLPLWYFRDCPMEICEIASMAMELFTIDDLPKIWVNSLQNKDAIEDKITKDLGFLPYMSKVDLMQQWMYDHPTHTVVERKKERRKLNDLYPYALRTGDTLAWEWEYDNYLDTYRHRQMHFFEVPFYYIEYGIAYLASLQLYNQFVVDRSSALANYKKILSAWYVHSIPDTMDLWGVHFDVSEQKLIELMQPMVEKYKALWL